MGAAARASFRPLASPGGAGRLRTAARCIRTPTSTLLFLCENEALRTRAKDPVRSICQELWDTGLRVSPTTRTLDDCGRFDQDNVEFTISLLDCRFLIGDEKLFARLHDKSVPQLVARESGILIQRLTEVTKTRHAKFGKTIFHLEPNLKDGPGGLRDFHVTRWIALIGDWKPAAPGRNRCICSRTPTTTMCSRRWSSCRRRAAICTTATTATKTSFPGRRRTNSPHAALAAAEGPLSSAEWMRLYFRNAKAIYRNATQVAGADC